MDCGLFNHLPGQKIRYYTNPGVLLSRTRFLRIIRAAVVILTHHIKDFFFLNDAIAGDCF
jgi:hypothetical protein